MFVAFWGVNIKTELIQCKKFGVNLTLFPAPTAAEKTFYYSQFSRVNCVHKIALFLNYFDAECKS
jgi:hypothetical protein